MPPLPLTEIQGLILRRYPMDRMRVLPLKVERRAEAGRFLASLADATTRTLKLTTAQRNDEVDYCLNLGLTHAGLKALALSEGSLNSFPDEFRVGAAARAERVADTGDSAPENWDDAFSPRRELHLLLFLYANSASRLDQLTSEVRLAMGSSLKQLSRDPYDSSKLEDNGVHFGYRDGLAQPTIEDAPVSRGNRRGVVIADILPESRTGEFLLGYPSQFAGHMYPVPQPSELGRNGSFLAFRLLHQDCDAFETFLTTASKNTGLDPELIAAKLCGRWRNGKPLSLAPDNPEEPVSEAMLNSFDYVPNGSRTVDDADGHRCPIGSHIRRMNPRHATVAGNAGLKRRIVRRGMPFGPPHRFGDKEKRGLLGLFICVSLQDQFEFIMSEWTNSGAFAGGTGGARDPIHGDHSSQGSNKAFRFLHNGQTVELPGLSRFVSCRGAAYCFLPSATALRHIASVAAVP